MIGLGSDKKLKGKCSHNFRQALIYQTGWKFYQAFNTLSELLPNLFYYCKLYWSAEILRRFSKEKKKGKERGPQLDAADIKMREEVKERGRGMDLVALLQTPYNNLTTTFEPLPTLFDTHNPLNTTPSQPHYNPHITFRYNQPLPPTRCSEN